MDLEDLEQVVPVEVSLAILALQDQAYFPAPRMLLELAISQYLEPRQTQVREYCRWYPKVDQSLPLSKVMASKRAHEAWKVLPTRVLAHRRVNSIVFHASFPRLIAPKLGQRQTWSKSNGALTCVSTIHDMSDSVVSDIELRAESEWLYIRYNTYVNIVK